MTAIRSHFKNSAELRRCGPRSHPTDEPAAVRRSVRRTVPACQEPETGAGLGLNRRPPAEWIGTLRSVLEARERGSLVVVELGAGWGPWLVSAAKAAERIGIRDVHLVGVEGAQSHVDFMLQHFRDNGLDPNAHLLIHGAVGARDGTARFPKLATPSDEWGAVADFGQGVAAGAAFDEIRCVALTTLLAQLPPVDLIHCDVQGAEYEVLTAARAVLEARVRRVVVGTHSRRIEADLLAFFAALGWRLEDEGACRLVQPGGRGALRLVRDGYQVWANPQLS